MEKVKFHSDQNVPSLQKTRTYGGFLAHAITLAARTLEPFHLKSPKFLTSLLCLLDALWQNFRYIDLSGKVLQSFIEQEVMKNKPQEHFLFLFKMADFFFRGGGGGIQFGVRKTIADHKSFILYE